MTEHKCQECGEKFHTLEGLMDHEDATTARGAAPDWTLGLARDEKEEEAWAH